MAFFAEQIKKTHARARIQTHIRACAIFFIDTIKLDLYKTMSVYKTHY